MISSPFDIELVRRSEAFRRTVTESDISIEQSGLVVLCDFASAIKDERYKPVPSLELKIVSAAAEPYEQFEHSGMLNTPAAASSCGVMIRYALEEP